MDEDEHGEEQHLLSDVLESDDEQAEPLSHDEIRRCLDDTRNRGRKSQQLENREGKELTGRGVSRGGLSPGRNNRMASANAHGDQPLIEIDDSRRTNGLTTQLIDEYDDIFDEELEDEPADLMVNARPKPVAWNPEAPCSSGEDTAPPSDSEKATRRLANTVVGASLADWIDMEDEEPRELLAMGSLDNSFSSVPSPRWGARLGMTGGAGAAAADFHSGSEDRLKLSSQQVSVDALAASAGPPSTAFASSFATAEKQQQQQQLQLQDGGGVASTPPRHVAPAAEAIPGAQHFDLGLDDEDAEALPLGSNNKFAAALASLNLDLNATSSSRDSSGASLGSQHVRQAGSPDQAAKTGLGGVGAGCTAVAFVGVGGGQLDDAGWRHGNGVPAGGSSRSISFDLDDDDL